MVGNTMDLNELIRKANDEHVDIDFLRDGIAMLAQALMEVDVTNRVGAALGERNPTRRTTQRNGYRSRRWDTRAGTVDLAIPKLRQGSYFPDFLLEPRRRAEKALAAVIMQAYVEGVSARRVDDVAKAMGIEGISRKRRHRASVRPLPGAAQPGDPSPHRRRRNLPRPRIGDPARRRSARRKHDEWQVGRRYMNQSTVREALISLIDIDDQLEEGAQQQLQAVTA